MVEYKIEQIPVWYICEIEHVHHDIEVNKIKRKAKTDSGSYIADTMRENKDKIRVGFQI